MKLFRTLRLGALYWILSGLLVNAWGQSLETTIKRRIQERIPEIGQIDEVLPTPMPGLFELRVNGNELFYADSKGDFLIRGELFDTNLRRNLTQVRADKLNVIAWSELPLKDAFVIRKGNGQREFAIFEDPNCSYCKKLERELQNMTNVTIHILLYPVLGPDSTQKSHNLWCAKDKGKAWEDWMNHGIKPAAASCDTTAIDRILAFGKTHRITGTPTLVLKSGQRIPGYIALQQLEQALKP